MGLAGAGVGERHEVKLCSGNGVKSAGDLSDLYFASLAIAFIKLYFNELMTAQNYHQLKKRQRCRPGIGVAKTTVPHD